MNIIAAYDKNNGLGYKGKLLCHLSKDLKQFKELTQNKVVIMGRKTMESLPNQKPLPNRRNIVLTRKPNELPQGFEGVSGLAQLTLLLANVKDEDIWIIGGGEIYKLFMPFCDKLYITEINSVFEADTFFPEFKSKREWVENKRSKTMVEDDIEYSFVEYTRRKK